MIHVLPLYKTAALLLRWESAQIINTASTSSKNWSRGLSPFLLGPVNCYDGKEAMNVENAWQYSKVYEEYIDEETGNPSKAWYEWRDAGWNKKTADRYPMGKGKIPLYSFWRGIKLSYVHARIQIYCPLYANAVERTDAYLKLKALYRKYGELVLLDFDAYDHRELEMTYRNVLFDSTRKMGHAFVLAMLLEDKRRWLKYE